MEDRVSPVNPRLYLLRREVEQKLLIPFRLHGWCAKIVREVDHHDCIEIVAKRGAVATRIAVHYSSSGISNASYRDLSKRVDRIFFNGQPYELDSFANGVTIPVEPLDDFFPFLQCATAPVRFGSRVDDTMTAYRLSKAVNDSRNEREDLIEPVA